MADKRWWLFQRRDKAPLERLLASSLRISARCVKTVCVHVLQERPDCILGLVPPQTTVKQGNFSPVSELRKKKKKSGFSRRQTSEEQNVADAWQVWLSDSHYSSK